MMLKKLTKFFQIKVPIKRQTAVVTCGVPVVQTASAEIIFMAEINKIINCR